MSELIKMHIEGKENPNAFIIEKERIFNIIKGWGKPFFYYDSNKNRFECDTQEKIEQLFEYIKKDSVTVYQCTFPAWYFIGRVKDWKNIWITVVENDEDIFWIGERTLLESIEYNVE